MAPMSDNAMSYIILASQAKGKQRYTNTHLQFCGMYPISAHHENLRRVCIMPVVDGFSLALDVSGLSRN